MYYGCTFKARFPERLYACSYETDVVAEPNAYKQKREKRKKALHDSVQLALIEFGFEEAAQLRATFIREDTSRTIACATPSRSRQRQKRVPEGHGEQP
jgi:hypothetical protein